MEIDINLSVLFHAIFYISIEIKSGAAGLPVTHCSEAIQSHTDYHYAARRNSPKERLGPHECIYAD